jgi:hypothetical protein
VPLDLTKTADDAAGEAFLPAEHLLGIVQRIIASGGNARIVLQGRGEIAVFSARGEYRADVRDMAEFCVAPAACFEVGAISEAVIASYPGQARHVRELLWSAAFHASQGRLVEGCSRYDVIQFRLWPNLTRLPATQNAARICALLTRHPTTVMLVHHILSIERKEVYQIYSAAHSAGLVEKVSKNPHSPGEEMQAQPVQARGLFRSLFAKIAGL